MALKIQSPADYVIKTFGGPAKTAQLLDVDPSTISCWRKRNKGHIPNRNWSSILSVASKKNLDVTLNHLMYGKPKERKAKGK